MKETRRSRALLLAALPVAVALIAAGCGGGGSNDNGGGSTSGGGASASGGGAYGGAGSGGSGGTAAASSGGGAISAKPNGDLNRTVLVDSTGDTVYLFERDESDESYCNGACAKAWPPVTTSGQPQASGAVDASKLGTVKRDDGTTQVTYAGHPLYTYVQDAKPGDATGNGVDAFGAEWYALEPSGAMAEEHGGGKSGKDESGGGGSGSGNGGGSGGTSY